MVLDGYGADSAYYVAIYSIRLAVQLQCAVQYTVIIYCNTLDCSWMFVGSCLGVEDFEMLIPKREFRVIRGSNATLLQLCTTLRYSTVQRLYVLQGAVQLSLLQCQYPEYSIQ